MQFRGSSFRTKRSIFTEYKSSAIHFQSQGGAIYSKPRSLPISLWQKKSNHEVFDQEDQHCPQNS